MSGTWSPGSKLGNCVSVHFPEERVWFLLKEVETLQNKNYFFRPVQPLHTNLCPFLGSLLFWRGQGNILRGLGWEEATQQGCLGLLKKAKIVPIAEGNRKESSLILSAIY